MDTWLPSRKQDVEKLSREKKGPLKLSRDWEGVKTVCKNVWGTWTSHLGPVFVNLANEVLAVKTALRS